MCKRDIIFIIIIIISFASSIVCLVSGIKKYKTRKVISKDIKTEEDCDALASKKTYKNGDKCPFWSDDSQCRYGIYNSSKCSEKKASAILLILAGVFAVITLILLIFYIKGYKKQTREYFSPEMTTDKKEGFFSRLFERIFGTKKRAEEQRRNKQERESQINADIEDDKRIERQKAEQKKNADIMKEEQKKVAIKEVEKMFQIANKNMDALKKKESEASFKLSTAVNGPGNMNARNIAKADYDTALLERLFAEGDKNAYDTLVEKKTFELIQAIKDAKYKK